MMITSRIRNTFAPSAMILSVALLLCGMAAEVRADGTEILGDPLGLNLAQGTDVIIAGVGLRDGQPAAINLTVPAGAAVQQVLIYWEGLDQTEAGQGATDTITLNGTEVITGDRIGGATLFFWNAWTSSYRKDITSLGLVVEGANSITVEGMDFSRANDGAGILVIVDDGTDPADIQIQDGNDCAFVNFVPPLDTTVPVTFDFAPADVERTARIALFVGSVALEGPSGPGRPSVVNIEIDGVLTEQLVDVLESSDGNEWDTLLHTVTIPAFATSLTVQLLSMDAGTGPFAGGLPASMIWITASFAMTTPTGGGEGCTPGYWKQPHHFGNWAAPFTPGMLFADVFEDAFPGMTLLEVLQQGGGGLRALGRHTVAALLSAASANVDYDLSVGEVIGLFNDAFPGSKPEYNILQNTFEELNELGCPLARAEVEATSGGSGLTGWENSGKKGHKAVIEIGIEGSGIVPALGCGTLGIVGPIVGFVGLFGLRFAMTR